MRNEWDWWFNQAKWQTSHSPNIWCDVTHGWNGKPIVLYRCVKCGLRWTKEREDKNEVWDFCEED